MKEILINSVVIMVLAISSVPPAVNAITPPPKLTLPERVKSSSHIFIGVIRRHYFIDGSGKCISAARAARVSQKMRNHPVVEVKIEVKETLLSRSTKLPRFVFFRYFLFGTTNYRPKDRAKGLANELAEAKKQTGKGYIFLVNKVSHPKQRTFFASAYDTLYYEKVTQKAVIQKIIKETETAAAKKDS